VSSKKTFERRYYYYYYYQTHLKYALSQPGGESQAISASGRGYTYSEVTARSAKNRKQWKDDYVMHAAHHDKILKLTDLKSAF